MKKLTFKSVHSWTGWILGGLITGMGTGGLINHKISIGAGVLMLLMGLSILARTIYIDYKEFCKTYKEE